MSLDPAAGLLADPGGALQWQRLSLLRGRMESNCQALAQRNPSLAAQISNFTPTCEYVMAFRADQMILARLEGTTAQVRPSVLSPNAARQVLPKLYPSGSCTEPMLVAGIDQGWLWKLIYELPVSTPVWPGYRPPLYFLARHIEELWLALHVHDWRTMLAEARAVLFAGEDAVAQFVQFLLDHPLWCWPRQAITLDKELWKDGTTLESVLALVAAAQTRQQEQLLAQYPGLYQWATPQAVAAKIRGGAKLRVLGITSVYTTFLQYSMRDWLAGFARLGHETRLLIEQTPHEVMNSLCFARTCVEFQPDLILLIDHYRDEFRGLPQQVPCVMWVQDRLPNIFCQAGGQRQSERDFCVGLARTHLVARHQYPKSRFLCAPMGINEQRFAGTAFSAADLDPYRCDVSYVSHASTPADVLLARRLAGVTQPEAVRAFQDLYERMSAHYAAGGDVLSEPALSRMLDEALARAGLTLAPPSRQETMVFFIQQINNALFRHQTLAWLIQSDVNLHLYGKGWEAHPLFRRYSKGVADNQSQLGLIYRASKINLQVTPYGSVHQRLLDGLAAGGFFLLRWHQGDVVGPLHQWLWDWCQRHQVDSEQQLQRVADAQVKQTIGSINDLEGFGTSARFMSVFDVMREHADMDFTLSAACIWSQYDQVAFRTQTELRTKLQHFLANPDERCRLAAAMGRAIVDRASYAATSRKMLGMIADVLGAASPAAAMI